MRVKFTTLLLTAGLMTPAGLLAQSKPTATPIESQEGKPAAPARPRIPLKITIVISRFTGEKGETRTGSLPNTLYVNTHDNATRLNRAAEVPVPQSVVSGGTPQPTASFSYRSVGTGINCIATTAEGNRYSVQLTVSDSAIFAADRSPSKLPAPTFQQFSSTATLLLRDGETVQYTTATDKATGEITKVDVTLNVVK